MLGQDLWYALRSLRKNPGFSLLAVLALALAIGAAGAIFSVVNGVMPPAFQFPYRETQFWGLNTADKRWPKWQTIRFADAFFGLGRLRPGVGFDQAQAEMRAISRRLSHDFPETDAGLDVRVIPL